MFFAKFSETL